MNKVTIRNKNFITYLNLTPISEGLISFAVVSPIPNKPPTRRPPPPPITPAPFRIFHIIKAIISTTGKADAVRDLCKIIY